MQRKQPRPVSIVITQILMLISLVPLSLGLLFFLVRSLVVNPSSLVSLRALLFFPISFALLTILLVYGFGGLWKGKRYGYWIGMLFLAAVNLKNIYTFVPNIYGLITTPHNQSYALLSHRSESLMILDLVVQGVLVVLVLMLFMKFALGKAERMFFVHH